MNGIFKIAVDGPAASGKSSVARNAAHILGFKYLNSGLFYRALTLKLFNMKVDPANISVDSMLKIATGTKFNYIKSLSTPTIGKAPNYMLLMDDLDVTPLLSNNEIVPLIKYVSDKAPIRNFIHQQLNQIANEQETDSNAGQLRGVIADGRDIGISLFPDANLKVFLTAQLDVRARRRAMEQDLSALESIKRDIAARDYSDTNREFGALKKAPDAIEIDTSEMTMDQVIQSIVSLAKERIEKVKLTQQN